MNKQLLCLPFLLAAAMPAHATSGMVCGTANPNPVEVSLVIGNTVGSPIVSGRLLDAGKSERSDIIGVSLVDTASGSDVGEPPVLESGVDG